MTCRQYDKAREARHRPGKERKDGLFPDEILGFYKVAVTAEGHIQSVSAVQKSDITDLGIPGSHQDISGKAEVLNRLFREVSFM